MAGAKQVTPPQIVSALWQAGVFPRELRVDLTDGRALHIPAYRLGVDPARLPLPVVTSATVMLDDHTWCIEVLFSFAAIVPEYTKEDLRSALARRRADETPALERAFVRRDELLEKDEKTETWRRVREQVRARERGQQPLVERTLSCKSCRRTFCTVLATEGAVIVVKCLGCEAERR